MKGLSGLVIAGALGVLGVGINMAYLHNKTKNIDTVSFVGIRQGVTIQTGSIIRKEDLEPVAIPASHAANLRNYVFLWEDRSTIAGIPATRMYRGGELVFVADYRTPPPRLTLAPDEVLLPIEVTSKSALIEPGDQVSFIIPAAAARPVSVLSGREADTPSSGAAASRPPVEMYGPFRVGAVGNRISSRRVMQAYRIRQVNENQLGIIVKKEGDQLEAKAMTLLAALQRVANRSVAVVLHSRSQAR